VKRAAERGEANALGLVLVTPIALAVALLILWTGRKVDTDVQVQAASSAAAQAAALQRSPLAAMDAATATAAAMLTDSTACAGGPTVSVDTSDFRAGGEVTVAVSCTPVVPDLGRFSPRPVTLEATSVAGIDAHRSAALP